MGLAKIKVLHRLGIRIILGLVWMIKMGYILYSLNPPLSGRPSYGHVPLPGSMKRLLSQQVNKMAMTTVAFTAIFEGKRVY